MTLEAQVEELALRLWLREGRKPYPVGTVRDWKGGKVIKTEKGWEPYTGQPAASPPAGAPPVAPSAPATGEPASGAENKKFSNADCAKTLSDFLSDPSEANQKAVRDQFNLLCSDFGMQSRDKPPGGEQFNAFKDKRLYQGVHDWSGKIEVRDKYVTRAAELLSGTPTETPPNKLRNAMHVLVHEAVHGHSPIRKENFKGRYRLLEEATTEMAARKVMKDRFGAKWTDMEDGAYAEFCSALSSGTRTALQRKGIEVPDVLEASGFKKWNDALGEACVEMRRRPPPQDPDKWAYLKRFASSLPIKGADAPDVVKEISEAVWLSLKPAKEQEKVYKAVALYKKMFASPDFQQASAQAQAKAKEMMKQEVKQAEERLQKAKQEWQDYLSGKGSAAGSGDAEESLNFMLQVLMEANPMKAKLDEDDGVLPRNDLPLAISYAKVLAEDGKLTPDTVQDLAMLQDDSLKAAKAISDALMKAGYSTPERE